jgi:multiple sugar transport system ATP-binding protein
MSPIDGMGQRDAGSRRQAGLRPASGHRPLNRFVAEFLGAPRMNFLEVRAFREPDGCLRIDAGAAGSLRLPDAAPVLAEAVSALGLRPQHLCLRPLDDHAALAATVEFVEQLGDMALVHCRLPGQASGLTLRCESPEQDQAAYGLARERPVRLGVAPQHMLLFDRQGTPLHW